MPTNCMYDIIDLPPATLRRVLPQTSSHVLIRLLAAYPRSAGRIFLALLSESLSPAAMAFLQDEMDHAGLPSLVQIRQAEAELIKLIQTADAAIPDIPLQAAA